MMSNPQFQGAVIALLIALAGLIGTAATYLRGRQNTIERKVDSTHDAVTDGNIKAQAYAAIEDYMMRNIANPTVMTGEIHQQLHRTVPQTTTDYVDSKVVIVMSKLEEITMQLEAIRAKVC